MKMCRSRMAARKTASSRLVRPLVAVGPRVEMGTAGTVCPSAVRMAEARTPRPKGQISASGRSGDSSEGSCFVGHRPLHGLGHGVGGPVASRRSELRVMKRKNKIKRQARSILINWLGVKLGIGVHWMSNHIALEHFNSRSSQNAANLLEAARIIRPGFATSVLPRSSVPAKQDKISAFYRSAEWKRARYDVLVANDGRCELCGAGKSDGVKLNVDHIKPLRLHWDRRLDPSNLQVLCGSCNQGKGNRDDTDWREPSLKVIMGEAME